MKGVIGVGSWKARFCLGYFKCSVTCLHANWNGRWWFSCSVTSNSLWPHGLQHTRPPCPSLSPGVSSNSCILSQWCHPTISSLSHPSPPALALSQHQCLFQWVGWFDLLAVQGTLKSLLQHHSSKASVLQHSAFFMVQLSHLYMTTRKTIAFIIWTFVSKVISLLFNTLSSFFSKEQEYFNFMTAVTIFSDFGVQENKVW